MVLTLTSRSTRFPILTALTCLLSLGSIAACASESVSNARSAATTTESSEWFVDRAAEAGLEFTHVSGRSGQYAFHEMVGPGAGLLDYDNDGDLDVYLVQGHLFGPPAGEPPDGAPVETPRPTDRLFRNDLTVDADGTRTLQFTDVTAQAGIVADGYGMGVATGDFTNDGWVDFYVTNYGPNQLYVNNGDGTFDEVSQRTGTADEWWSVSASVADVDRDGWLDLFVGNYVRYDPASAPQCRSQVGELDYCGPQNFDPQADRLYRNLGDGRFLDISANAQVAAEYGPALGVVADDFDADGWTDIYVANDGGRNLLWVNGRDGTFRNQALMAGAALNEVGRAEASMGVTTGDIDGDGDTDLFMTHLDQETNTVYVNDGQGLFEDRSTWTGVGPPSLAYTGFGTGWLDVDNDGWLDLFVANGAVKAIEALARQHDPLPLHQPNQLFRNLGGGRFEEVTARAGSVFELSEVSRGAAFGDIDNDGDTDVVVANNSGRVRLLINQVGQANHWIGVRLVGAEHGRDMLGSRVGVFRTDGPPLWRRSRSDGSYASANDPRVLIGLGRRPDVQRLRVMWPDGSVEEWETPTVDVWTTLIQGTGTRVHDGT